MPIQKGPANLGTGSVDSTELSNTLDLSAKTVTYRTIVAGDIASNAITTAKVADTAITPAKMANSGAELGFRNKLINGNFDVWQRGTSLTFSATNTYLADRWKMGGQSITASQQTFTVGQTEVPGNPRYYFRYVVGANSQNYEIQQLIEDVRLLAGQTVTLTYYARRTSGTVSIGPRFVQDFGTGGSPSGLVVVNPTQVGSQTLTTSWQKFTYNATLPSISGKTIGTDANTSSTWLSFQIGDTNTGTVEYAQIQVEIGSVATPFEVRPYGTELSLCQRYFYKTNPSDIARCGGMAGNAYNTTYGVVCMSLPVTMRATPTITRGGTLDNFYEAGVNGTLSATIALGTYSPTTLWWELNGSFSAGYQLTYNGQVSVNAEL